jgi:hypothetical protein
MKESIRFVDLRKEAERKKEKNIGFFDQLDVLDFRDDLKFN